MFGSNSLFTVNPVDMNIFSPTYGTSMDIPAAIMIVVITIVIFCVWNLGDMYQRVHGFQGCPE